MTDNEETAKNTADYLRAQTELNDTAELIVTSGATLVSLTRLDIAWAWASREACKGQNARLVTPIQAALNAAVFNVMLHGANVDRLVALGTALTAWRYANPDQSGLMTTATP